MEENIEGTISEQNKNNPDREYYLDVERGFETDFSTISLAQVTEIEKEKKTRLTTTRPPEIVTVHFYKHTQGSQGPRTSNV